MIKILLLIFVFSLIVYIGYGIFNYYKTRASFFKDLTTFINKLDDEISFLKSDLVSLTCAEKQVYGDEFNSVLKEFHNHLTSLSKEFIANSNFLTREELNEINTFFNSLGKSGLEEQKVCIAFYKRRFNEQFQKLIGEKESYGIVGFKLCIALGFFICIVFI